MSKDETGTEYVFIAKGVEHYEIVFSSKDVAVFRKPYGADLSVCQSLASWEKEKTRFEEGEYFLGDQPFTCPRCGARTEAQPDGRERCQSDGLQFRTTSEGEAVEYYDCGICGYLHSMDFYGDCRDDTARFSPPQLDEKHGAAGWTIVPIDGGEDVEEIENEGD